MYKNSTLTVRVNLEEKIRAAQVLDELGMNLSTAVNALIKQIGIKEALPFEISQSSMRLYENLSRDSLSRDEKDLLFNHYRKNYYRERREENKRHPENQLYDQFNSQFYNY